MLWQSAALLPRILPKTALASCRDAAHSAGKSWELKLARAARSAVDLRLARRARAEQQILR